MPKNEVVGVIAAIGVSTLGVIASAAIGGIVSGTLYESSSIISIVYTDVWSFTASTGDTYGPFTTQFAV